MNTESHPYSRLSQEDVMDAVESLGLYSDARVFPLNSYENRVYQVGIDDEQPVIAKFYRPNRWSQQSIREEHQFMLQLQEEDIPVVAPLQFDGETLFEHKEFMFTLFPRRGGHAPELSSKHDLELLGRWLARIHQVGGWQPFQHRPQVDPANDIKQAAETLLNSGMMPDDYRAVYDSLWPQLQQLVEQQYSNDHRSIRLHGDLHTGNLLLREQQLWLVDFDDCRQGPAMQDIWMLLSGSREEQLQQLESIRLGYEMFLPFPASELKMVECLRTRRVMQHAAWICQRWDDPAFPIAFPWFEGHRFWSEHLLTLREQVAALYEEPLTLFG